MVLAPPPDGACFPSWADCYRFVQGHAASEGYAVNSKGQAKSRDSGLYRRYVIRCDKSGRFKSSATIGVRRCSSKKTDCPFSAACNIRPDGCYLRVLVAEHNHPPSTPGEHVQHRKLTDEQRQLVEGRAVERKSIKVIWNELKEIYPDTLITFKDVDNAVQRFRKRAKDGATGVQAIMYRLVERQDLYCFTLEREGVLQGAFWVPRWTTDLWMRPNGTPDILVMLAEHIANRPVLPILEMNSVLNSGFREEQPTRALPVDPINPNIDPELVPRLNATPAPAPSADALTASDTNTNTDTNSNGSNNETKDNQDLIFNLMPTTPGAQNTQNMQSQQIPQNPQNTPHDTRGNNVFDSPLGAGYAILPDKKDATMLWLRSAVEMLRQRIPHCPKPRFLTFTDFQTAEKNIMVEVSKGGAAHRQNHIVFGRVLGNDEGEPVHHGPRNRKSRVETGPRRDSDGTTGSDDEMEDGNGDEDQSYGVDDQEAEDIEEGDEDHDMDGDHSDAEIARQLTVSSMQGPQDNYTEHERLHNYPHPNQDPVETFNMLPGSQPR
ncbi:hypothetical protein F4808DRAFT_22954 [Astrocystis sublimbata]|nr:hypothetical protein F4808DRAFT_22954 [Astrocystis sublimbata]